MPDSATMAGWLRKATSMPPHRTAALAGRRLTREIRRRGARTRDLARPTYLTEPEAPRTLRRRVGPPDSAVLAGRRSDLMARAIDTLDHRFDLLGSGPVVPAHGLKCVGLEGLSFPAGPAVAADATGEWLRGRVPEPSWTESRRVWSLIEPSYEPIDWQLDFRSGFRWSAQTWSPDLRYGDIRGADVKLPWELARMQHLPPLALAALATEDSDPELAARCRLEFRSQVLDFIATNPPRFGVNWTTTMDVAIRIANWLVAWDLFTATGESFDDAFALTFRRSVLEHARHIASNLEWAPVGRGNHYLADIVGLLFASAWLPEGPEVLRWETLATAELMTEAQRQLQSDGTGFEASTSYHRLSVEMITWATALICGMGAASSIPTWLVERLGLAAEFTIDVTKSSGLVAQIGDNDDGRFLRLGSGPSLDHRSLVAIVGTLLRRSDLKIFGRDDDLDSAVVLALTGGATVGRSEAPSSQRAGQARVVSHPGVARPAQGSVAVDIDLPAGSGAENGPRPSAYPDFGLFIMRSDRVFLAIRCGSVGQDGIGGHAHNDQLSIELCVDGLDWIRDPGSFVYTPLPERRNAYRSVGAHYVPRLGGQEPGDLTRNLFQIGDPKVGRCLAFGPDGFVGQLTVGRATLTARISLEPDRVHLVYEFEGAEPDPRLASGDWRALLPTVPFSPGYGVIETGP